MNATDPAAPQTRRLVVISGGLRQPSSTRLLADRLTEAVVRGLGDAGLPVEVSVVELREHARDLTSMLLTGFATPALQTALDAVGAADGLVLVTPIYSGSYTGMVKDLADLLPDGAIAGVPVLMGATAGTARHSLALEHAVRPLLSHLRAAVVPTGVFAATEDFGEVDGSTTADAHPLAVRVERGARELVAQMASRPPRGAAPDPFALTSTFEDLIAGM